MVRGAKRVNTGPSVLSQLVAHLRAPPKLSLPEISSLRLTLAARNDHFGARHFLKEQLPRIRFANPDMQIHVRKMTKRPYEGWRPELQISFRNGNTETLNLHAKWSTAIVRELMDLAGAPSWLRWKAEAARTGVPLVPGAEHEPQVFPEDHPEPRFTLDEWRVKHSRKERRRLELEAAEEKIVAAPVSVAPIRTPEQIAAEAAAVKEEAEKRKAAKKEARRAKLDAPRLAQEEAEQRVALELLSKPKTGAAAILP
ncbi:hypothetical protein B0H16DRAFT_1739450 [Mycena metata]|uniref:Ribosomal protein/NADH dehydrogenase domain-containing protein n=1 Tax=Mycena metata TaxID=1033252 RepID=A0AAD7MIX6_9AGAR|nr:hypothetical protein B0H16DRAFT_1739450 [Mycena metata]